MKSKSLKELLNKVDELYQIHNTTRGILQYVKDSSIGLNELKWRSKIPSNSFEIKYSFNCPITQQSVLELNSISEYMNQNFILRLHSLLEYEGILGAKTNINTKIEGFKMLQFIHFLRKEFAHKTGKYYNDSKDSTKLRNELFAYFKIDSSESLPNQFPLDKNRVIKPIVEGVKKYIELSGLKDK
jgi:hypothetical protein